MHYFTFLLILISPLFGPKQDQVLVFTKTDGYRHESIAVGVETIKELGKANKFTVVHTEDSDKFTTDYLKQFKLVLFLNTSDDVLNEGQQKAFKAYINNGGSFMGVHAATDTEKDWPWYGKLVGAYFTNHPDKSNAEMVRINKKHISCKHLPKRWKRFDEWYNFESINPNINVLLQLDESTYTGGENGDFHPIAWYHEFDGGRSFYTGGGHTKASYKEPDFRKHLLGGIFYCLKRD